MLRRSVCLVIATLPACAGPEPNATLADLPGLRVGVAVMDASDEQAPRVAVSISYDHDAFLARHGDCATLGSIEASLDGHALDHDYGGGADTDFGGCHSPSFADEWLRFAGDGPIVLTMRDASHEVRAELAADALAPHTPTPLEPATWSLRVGQQVRVRWSHPPDLIGASVFDAVWLGLDRGGDPVQLLPTFTADEIQFTIPSWLSTGPARIAFSFGWTGGEATSCAGAEECRYGLNREYGQRVVIEP